MKNAKTKQRQRGFIALISAIVISAILLALMSAAGAATFYARFDAFGNESKRAARALSDACAQAGLLSIASASPTSAYQPSDLAVQIGTDYSGNALSCALSVSDATSGILIKASASFARAFSAVSVVATSTASGITIVSWTESD